MSQYYTPHRSASWNYGGDKWKLSRSKIDLFLGCPRCFYLDNKLGVKRPAGYPFNLNTAVDTLLKKEFDLHRVKGTQHILQKEYKIDAIPIPHEDLDAWRHNFTGIQYLHPGTKMTISGAIDDLWQNSKEEYIVVDYKSTSINEDIKDIDKDWQASYKRQMEVYQWLLRQKGYPVSDTGYFVYCNGRTDKKAFDKKLEFDVTLISYIGNADWVEGTIKDIHECLNKKNIPRSDPECAYCQYRGAVEKVSKNKLWAGTLF
ncbi:MAG TPA: PD-(D/E)XK nuclease family protein [Patescibacteria group bacterium]